MQISLIYCVRSGALEKWDFEKKKKALELVSKFNLRHRSAIFFVSPQRGKEFTPQEYRSNVLRSGNQYKPKERLFPAYVVEKLRFQKFSITGFRVFRWLKEKACISLIARATMVAKVMVERQLSPLPNVRKHSRLPRALWRTLL